MLRFTVLLITLHLIMGATIKTICPDNCDCQTPNEAVCNSFDFIKKLTPKQITTIINLKIKNSGINNIDSKLKYMKNLNILDLSNNNIATLPSQFPYLPKLKSLNLTKNYLKEVTFENLPKNLEILDLSYNTISYFPKDWKKLQHLKLLRLDNNPIDCDCDNLFIYEQLNLHDIKMPELTCHYPKEFNGISLDKINCSMIKNNLLNTMLNDDGGSGLTETLSNTYFEHNPTTSSEFDEQFLNTTTYPESEQQQDIIDEGSGDEGSGYLIPIEEIPRACNFNCSTVKPLGADDENDASPPPSLKEQIGIIFNDIFGVAETTTISTTTTTTTTTTETTSTTPAISNELDEDDENLKEIEPIVKISDKDLVETFPTNDTVLGEMERASVVDSNAQTVYIVVGLVVAFLAFALIYFVNKKRNKNDKRRRNKNNEECFGEEMKPLEKQVVDKLQTTKPEESPLLNGQNGKINDDDNIKPETNGKTNDDNVELRKPHDGPLTPQLERVTIKSGEIPDSIPKTPMLVHRQLNNEGEIVTTVISK